MGSGMVRYEQYVSWFKRHSTLLADIFDPLPVLIEKLQKFNPVMIGSYPSSLDILAQEQLCGNMKISPLKVINSGEHLADSVRKRMREAFGCRVVSSYISTEGGPMANECMCGHMHVNDDWIIIEPVDKDNKPVASGKTADKLLMTNMCNFIQPFIRYEVTDRIVYHDEGCDCGNPSPWVEVEGRSHDILYFRGENGMVKIMPTTIFILLKNIHEMKNFQVFLHDGHRLELRIVAEDRLLAFERARKVVDDHLSKNGVSASIYLSEKAPELEPSGKYFHVRHVS
jgi:phenylacetate-coenzyme A ligase PaaK-like adenylate-forming protein